MKHLDLSFQPLGETDWDECDTVMMTGMTIQAEEVMRLAREAKRRGKTVVIGGPWVFHASEEARAAGADIVVVGEVEGAMERLLECLDNDDYGHVIRGPLADMTTSPPPRWGSARYEKLHVDAGAVLPWLPVPLRVLRRHRHDGQDGTRQDTAAGAE